MLGIFQEEGEPIMIETTTIEKIRYTYNDSEYLDLFRDDTRGITLAYIRRVDDSEFPYRANVLFYDSELSCQNYDIALEYVYRRCRIQTGEDFPRSEYTDLERCF